MQESINYLLNRISKVCDKDYLLTQNNAGLLFESLLDIEANGFSVPDFNGIEIKVSNDDYNYPISLFSCTFDGKDFFEAKRFLTKFGANDKTFPSQKILYVDVNAKEFNYWGKYLKFKLSVDYRNKRIYVLVANVNGKVIEKRAYWDFNTIFCSLKRKLSCICLVNYISYYYKNKKYCRFFSPIILKYSNFDNFLKLVNDGNIFVSINCGVYRSGKNIGKTCIHGFTFKIKKTALQELFEVKKK